MWIFSFSLEYFCIAIILFFKSFLSSPIYKLGSKLLGLSYPVLDGISDVIEINPFFLLAYMQLLRQNVNICDQYLYKICYV